MRLSSRQAGIDRGKDPTLCMVIGCARKALYRRPDVNSAHGRGYCAEHKARALGSKPGIGQRAAWLSAAASEGRAEFPDRELKPLWNKRTRRARGVTDVEQHHAQCPWAEVDPTHERSICGCPPGWPKRRD